MAQRRTVLLADASTELRTLLRETLERTGDFAVEVAGDGGEALEKARRQLPEYFIADVTLPVLDGLSVLRELHADGIVPQAIMTSAFISDAVMTDCSELGVAYFLPKPYTPDVLLEKLRNLINTASKDGLPTLRVAVTETLHELGVRSHMRGYQYLREAVVMVSRDSAVLRAITKVLYPTIGRMYNTTGPRVERSMRHAISDTWEHGDPIALKAVFGALYGDGRSRPSNSCFVATLVDYLLMKYNGKLPDDGLDQLDA